MRTKSHVLLEPARTVLGTHYRSRRDSRPGAKRLHHRLHPGVEEEFDLGRGLVSAGFLLAAHRTAVFSVVRLSTCQDTFGAETAPPTALRKQASATTGGVHARLVPGSPVGRTECGALGRGQPARASFRR